MRLALALVALLAMSGCGGDSAAPTAAPTAPVPSSPASSGPAPALGTVTVVPFLRGFDQPLDMQPIPGTGRLAVVEKTGLVRVVQHGSLQPDALLDLRGRVSTGSEQGLLSIAFPPGYREGGDAYVDYTDSAGDTHVARLDTATGSLADVVVIHQPYTNHNGGALAFGPDGLLYVGMGDGGSEGDPHGNGQNRDTLLGKILRFDVGSPTPEPQQFAYGLRNPWRFAFDGHDLWIGDVGQNTWEEVDRIDAGAAPGANLGWNAYEGREVYKQQQIDSSRLVFPVAVYSHRLGCSITGGYVYRGADVPALRGRYVFGDYCSGRIWSLPVSGGKPSLLPGIRVPGLSSFGRDASGELYAISLEGTIWRFTAGP
jgi:glucose/arabinose dehydrogenase